MVNCAENQLLHFSLPEVRYLFRHGCTESDQTPLAETQPKPVCVRCNLSDDQRTYNVFPLGSACTPFGGTFHYLFLSPLWHLKHFKLISLRVFPIPNEYTSHLQPFIINGIMLLTGFRASE